MNNESTTEQPSDNANRKPVPADKAGNNIMAGVIVATLIMAILWAAWKFGGIVLSRITPDQAPDRLGVCIIVAAILHAHFTTTRTRR
jgi:hypothetical protein